MGARASAPDRAAGFRPLELPKACLAPRRLATALVEAIIAAMLLCTGDTHRDELIVGRLGSFSERRLELG